MQSKTGSGRKILYIVLSFLIAVAIWVYVDNEEGYRVSIQVKDIPIEYLGENTTLADRGLMLLSDSDSALSLKLEGTRKVLMRLDPADIRVQVDLSDITATGTQSLKYNIIYPSSEFTNSLTLKSASAYSVTVDIGELYSRDVDVRCDITGAVAEGYIAGELQLSPKTLELRGQQSDVDKVSYAKVTLAIDNATQTVSQSLNYTLYDSGDQEVSSTNIHPTVGQIQVTLPVNVVKELPLKMNFVEAPGSVLSNVDYTIEPAFITVSGDAAKLKDVDSIVLDTFRLANLEGATTYSYAITVPDGCENLSGVTRAKLRIAFKDMATATLNAVNFECVNIPEGKEVTVLTTELPVTLRGTAAAVAAVLPENLTVTADLKDVSSASGSYTVPAAVTIGGDSDAGVVGSYQVKVTISEGESQQP